MNIKELESVVAVFRYRSFTEAAYRTAFSASAVSKHVQHVEAELGVRLFNRKTYKNNKLLTEEGERLMPYLVQTVDSMRLVSNMAREMHSQSTVVRLGSIAVMRGSAIDRILAEFSLKYPDITIDTRYMHLKEIIHAIDTLELDCALLLYNSGVPLSLLRAIREMSSENITTCMGRSQSDMHIAISNSHPLANRDAISLRDIADETFLLDLDAEQFPQGALDITQTLGRSFDRIKKKFIDSKNENMVLEIVAAGGGVFPKTNMQRIEFPGVTFLPVSDWPTDASCLFIFRRGNDHRSFQLLKRHIEASIELSVI